jgi:hypothetical protein
LWVIFPDGKEATLANERWGGVNFRILGIETAMKTPKEEVCELQVCVRELGWMVEKSFPCVSSCCAVSPFSLLSLLPSLFLFTKFRWWSLQALTCKNTSTSRRFDGLASQWWW